MEQDPSPNPDAPVRPAAIPARVWLSRLGMPGGEIEGTLRLTATHLRFEHRRGSDHEVVPLTAIRKVKRPVGSPVLYVEYTRDAEPVRLAFFFAQPPPIEEDASKVRARRKRSDNAGFMWQQSGDVATVVRLWRDAIRVAVKRARTTD